MNPYKEWNCGDTTVQYNKLASDSYEIAFATLFNSARFIALLPPLRHRSVAT